MNKIIFECDAKSSICDQASIARLLWKAMIDGGDLASNDPELDERIPIGPTDI